MAFDTAAECETFIATRWVKSEKKHEEFKLERYRCMPSGAVYSHTQPKNKTIVTRQEIESNSPPLHNVFTAHPKFHYFIFLLKQQPQKSFETLSRYLQALRKQIQLRTKPRRYPTLHRHIIPPLFSVVQRHKRRIISDDPKHMAGGVPGGSGKRQDRKSEK